MATRLLKYGALLLVCSAALGVSQSVIVGAAATPGPFSSMKQCGFIPDGYFYLKGNPPGGFEDFDHITLLALRNGPRPPADSRLHTSDGKVYKFTKLGKFITHSSGRGIVFEFETEMIEGVSYKLKGRFISICNFPEDETDPKKPVAEGRITKLKDGQETTSAEVQFTYFKSQRPRP
jgi:hypothetical protein